MYNPLEANMKRSVRDFLRKTGLQIPEERDLKSLLKLSALTEPQVEVLLVELASTNLGRKLTFKEKAKIRGVSKGAYARTLRQAIENIKRSIYTLFLLKYLGIIGDGAVSSILEAAEVLNQGKIEESVRLISDVMLRDVTA